MTGLIKLTCLTADEYEAALYRRNELSIELDWRYAEADVEDEDDCSTIRDLENEQTALTTACIVYETNVLNLQHIW